MPKPHRILGGVKPPLRAAHVRKVLRGFIIFDYSHYLGNSLLSHDISAYAYQGPKHRVALVIYVLAVLADFKYSFAIAIN